MLGLILLVSLAADKSTDAVWRPVAVVVPAKPPADHDQNEWKSAEENAKMVAKMLDETGIGADLLDESAIADGALAQRRAAVLPYNPNLGGPCVVALERFVHAGGKLVVCYWLPDRLGKLLGFGPGSYVRQQRDGQFAEMRFDASDIEGMPKSVHQKSWNITAAEPVGHNARVIGRWFDEAGQPVGQPAVLLSDRGAWLSHIVLPDDREGKKRLLTALLGHLCPPLWKALAQNHLDRMGRVGHCDGMETLLAHLKASGAALDDAQRVIDRAGKQFSQGEYAQAVDTSRQARDLLVETYLRSVESPSREGRAVWNQSGTGAYPGDWDRSAKLLAQNGFNMVLPNMLWGGMAHYPSDVLPRSATFEKYGDQVAQCCAAAKKHGLEVHVWKVNYYLGWAAPKEFVDSMRRDGRTQVSVHGKPIDWLCPSHPDNIKLERDAMLEVARKYPIDGLHFDYIRYPGREYCYCDGCRGRFEAQSGRPVADWPADCFSGPRKEEYNDWRCQQIGLLVETVSKESRKMRSGLKISAAVFGGYPDSRRSVAQDWPEWVKAGRLDFLCPMDYTDDDAAFVSLVRNQLRLVAGRTPLYPGIGATATGLLLGPDQVVAQIREARRLGAAGYTVFDFEPRTAETIVPGIGLGAGSKRAWPPHRAPELNK